MSSPEAAPTGKPKRGKGTTALAAEAVHLDLNVEMYLGLSNQERILARTSALRALKAEAEKYGLEPDEYVLLSKKERGKRRVEARITGGVVPKPDEGDAEENEEPVYTAHDEVPANEADPRKRAGVTVGPIEEIEEPPKVMKRLQDVFARFRRIGETDSGYYIRVERTQPKFYQGIACAGYLGDIKQRLTEADFQRYFGGREYHLQVFGPNPKGKQDEQTGGPVIQALTGEISITVPVLPPNLAVLPAIKDEENMQTQQPWNPFAAAQTPASQADAKIHEVATKALMDVASAERQSKETAERRVADTAARTSDQLIGVMKDHHADQMAMAQKDKERADERFAEERAERKRLEGELAEIKKALGAQKNGSGDAVEMIKALSPQRNASDEIARISESFKEQIDKLRESHRDAMEAMKDRHADEMKRAQDRHSEELSRLRSRSDDETSTYKKLLEEERAKRIERERELKDETDRRVKEERDVAERRLQEEKSHSEKRLTDLEKQHERERRMLEAQHDVKLTTEKKVMEMELSAAKERVEELREDLEEARAEAKENSDPIAIFEKAKEQAEKLGYSKDEDKKTAFEQFAAMAGSGVGQALSTMDRWLPQVMSRFGSGGAAAAPGQPGQRALPGAQAAGQPGAPVRRRAVAWSTEGATPPTVAAAPQHVPDSPLGFQPEQQKVEPAQQAPAAQAQAQPAAQQPSAQQAAPAQTAGATTNPLGKIFNDESIEGFRAGVEGAINGGVPPEAFANGLMREYPRESRALVHLYKADDFVGYVKTRSPQSAILRRDGREWVSAMWEVIRKAAAPAAA